MMILLRQDPTVCEPLKQSGAFQIVAGTRGIPGAPIQLITPFAGEFILRVGSALLL